LVQAIDMRAIVNEHLPPMIEQTPVHPVKTRLLEVLVAESVGVNRVRRAHDDGHLGVLIGPSPEARNCCESGGN